MIPLPEDHASRLAALIELLIRNGTIDADDFERTRLRIFGEILAAREKVDIAALPKKSGPCGAC